MDNHLSPPNTNRVPVKPKPDLKVARRHTVMVMGDKKL